VLLHRIATLPRGGWPGWRLSVDVDSATAVGELARRPHVHVEPPARR
jgi:hypothetical protein